MDASDQAGTGSGRRPPPAAIAAVLAAAVLFGSSGTARELGSESASSLSVGAARITIGSLVLWSVVLATRRRDPLPDMSSLRRLRTLLLVGGLGVAAYTPLFFVAVDRAGVAVGTVVAIASGPFFAAALDWWFRRVRPSMPWLLGTLVTVVGATAMIFGVDAGGSDIQPVGVAAALAAGLGYATYSVTSKATMERGLASTLALAIPFTIGVLAVVVMAVPESWAWLGTRSGLVMALYLGIVATGVAYALFGYGLRRLTSASAVTLVLAEPLTAVVLAAAILDEPIPWSGWVGVAVVIAGLALVGRSAAAPGRRPG